MSPKKLHTISSTVTSHLRALYIMNVGEMSPHMVIVCCSIVAFGAGKRWIQSANALVVVKAVFSLVGSRTLVTFER